MVLTEQQSRLLSGLYSWLQQSGMFIVPARPLAHALQHLEQLPHGFTKDLNLDKNYVPDYRCDERELVQNFRDRCADLSRTQHIRRFIPSAVQASAWQSFAAAGIEQLYIIIEDLSYPCVSPVKPVAQYASGYWEHDKPHILGHIVEYINAQGMRCLDLCNHSTLMSVDMFKLGGSDKAKKAHTAGHFGEGMKVQINRLMVDSQLLVTYSTGPCLFNFSHMCSDHCSESLHLHSHHLQQEHGHPTADPSRRDQTVCSIVGVPASLPGIDSSQYLFLQQPQSLVPSSSLPEKLSQHPKMSSIARAIPGFQWFPCIRIQDPHQQFSMEILLAPQMHGRFFTHDILLKEVADGQFKKLHYMGFNFAGSTQILRKYNLNRDRNSAAIANLLCDLLPKVVAQLEQQDHPYTKAQLECLTAHLYLELSEQYTIFNQWGYQWPASISSLMLSQHPGSLLAAKLADFLGPSNGLPRNTAPQPYPFTEKVSGSQQAEIRLLGYQPVQATQLLIDIWTGQKILMSIEQLWLAQRQKVAAMTDAMLSWEENCRLEGEKVLQAIAGLLMSIGPEIGLPATAAAFRGMMKVLSLPKHHDCYHNHVIIPFKGDRSAGFGPLLVYEAEYFVSQDSVHNRMELAGELCPSTPNSCGGKCVLDLLLQETMEALQKWGVDGKKLNKLVMRQMLALTGAKLQSLGTQPSQVPAAVSGPSSHQASASSSASAGVLTVDTSKVGEGDCCNYAAPKDINSSVDRSLFPSSTSSAPTVVKGRPEPDPAPDANQVAMVCGAEKDLLVTQVVLKQANGLATAYLYLPEGVAATPQTAGNAQQVYAAMEFMLQRVFANDADGPLPQFFVYYDPERSSVAFNKGGQLWFNAAAQVDVSGFKHPEYGLCRFWFLVVCHELAHNQVKPHNSSFADACSAIALQYAEKFRVFAQEHCGGCC